MKTFVDLFCGGGLGARGAVTAGLRPVVAVDNWKLACETYRSNFPDAIVLEEAIEDINPLDYAEAGSVDLLLASPECTNHSVAKGAAARDEKSKETALYTIEWLAALKPSWFIIENVKEMRVWHRYAEFKKSLDDLGYSVKEELINAVDYGAPQSRTRLFIIGGLNRSVPRIFPAEGTPVKAIRDILAPDDTWKFSPVFGAERAENTEARARNAIAELGKDAEFLLVYYGSGGDRGWQRLNQPLRTITTLDRFALVKKLRGRYVMRMLQPPELAKAMSLPDAHKFPFGTRRQKIKLCGNGICSVVVERIVDLLKAADAAATVNAQSASSQLECVF